jgi:hypothetical protein
MRKFVILLILLLQPLLLLAQIDFANSSIQHKPNLTNAINLRVRTFVASNQSTDEHSEQKHSDQKIDERLADLKNRLKELPYDTFTLKSFENVQVPVKKREMVRLPNGQTLEFRLLYRDDHKLGMWLDWHDEYGLQLLNSRMHLSCKESFLAGTEDSRGGAYFLAVALDR